MVSMAILLHYIHKFNTVITQSHWLQLSKQMPETQLITRFTQCQLYPGPMYTKRRLMDIR